MRSPNAARIGDILLKGGVIDESQLHLALAQCDRRGGRLAQVIAEMGLASEERIVDALARALRVERIHLRDLAQDPNALARLEASYAEDRAVFPAELRDNGRTLVLAMADPSDLVTIDDVQRKLRTRVIARIAPEREIRAAIFAGYYGKGDAFELPAATTGEYPGEFTTLSGQSLRPGRTLPPSSDPSPVYPTGARSAGGRASGAMPPAGSWPEDAVRRLQALKAQQESSGRVVRAIAELLIEKGRLTSEELRRRLPQL